MVSELLASTASSLIDLTTVEVAEAAAVLIGGSDVKAANLSNRDFLEREVQNLLNEWRYQSRVRPPWKYIMIAMYVTMIVVGSVGNLMVIYVVARNASMRTARNIFIVNLAISDLMLCLITMPLTLVEILYLTWQFGNFEAACRMIGLLQGTSVFVSTITITAIALDRRRLIVGSEQESPRDMGKMVASIPVIWATALAMASPLAIWKTLENWTGWTVSLFSNETEFCDFSAVNQTHELEENTNCILQEIIIGKLSELQTCTETFPEGGRAFYSIFVLLFQFLLPMVTLSAAYYQICQTLRLRLEQRVRQQRQRLQTTPVPGGAQTTQVPGGGGNGTIIQGNGETQALIWDRQRSSVLRRNDARRERNIIRLKRTIKLLCWIGAIFCICWLPLNLWNAVLDSTKLTVSISDEVFCGVYAVFHVLGMSSACANPVIYGFLNENFSKEFRLILQWWKDQLSKVIRICIPGFGSNDDHVTVITQPIIAPDQIVCHDKDLPSNIVELKHIPK